MSDMVKGVITSRNTIVEETQCLSNNNINSISSYQEKTILTLDNGKQYSTMLKVNAQCGDKVLLLLNSETFDVEAIFDKNNYKEYKQESFDKGHFIRIGSLSFGLNFGAFGFIQALNLNQSLNFNIPNAVIFAWFILSLLVSLAMVGCLMQPNKNSKKDTDRIEYTEDNLKDFFSENKEDRHESISEIEMLKL